LGERWNLPPKLIGVIGHHHDPAAAGPFTLEAAIIHLADILCRSLNIGSGGDEKIPPLDALAWKALKIKTPAIQPILEAIKKEYDDISLFISYTP
jgi:HD-like signal output (HDOD) protein